MKKKVIERIVRGSGAPNTQDIWLNDNLEMKVYENEQWKTIAGGEGGGSGGCDCEGPLMIAGTWVEENHYQFTPDEGEPTIDDAVVAFKAGRTVVLHITADYELNDQPMVANYYSPLLVYEEAGAAPHFTYRADGEYMEWYVPSGDDGPGDLNPHPVI